MISAGAGASGASGMAAALPAANKAAARKALVRIVFMRCSPGANEPVGSVGRSERDTSAHLANCLVDHAQGALAVTALVRGRGGEFGAGVLQQTNAGLHMRLRADGITNAHAGCDRGTQQDLAGRRVFHVGSPGRQSPSLQSRVVLERGTLPAAAAGTSVNRANRIVLD